MSISSSVKKRIVSLVSSGFGEDYDAVESVGSYLYSVKLPEGVFYISETGVHLKGGRGGVDILFLDISEIRSHLSAELCSEVSNKRDVEFFVPLEIFSQRFVMALHVPFLAYSRFLNVLTELRSANLTKAGTDHIYRGGG
ncbi:MULTISPECIES: hypothetical protein [unclassified Pseudomonas]|uniref:hypothetical protein n=1 Tax=unclassified Pseudomonas TaxID=196821 RepID=UPI0011B3A04C|nr:MULTISPECIES: hypothetical protein [unclassified Pseudomonas]QZP35861.1 hypothetical protein K5K95_16220 [Pseudomonas sp. DR48]